MTRAELLARIRKCLALAKSANEHEAAAALAKARQLIDEHGLDQTDVDALDVEERRAKGGAAWTPSRWETVLARSVQRAIPVERIAIPSDGWAFVGLTPAPEIAAYAFTALYRQLKLARAEYMCDKLSRVRTPQRKTARADAFAEGWAGAVYRAIAAIYPQRETDDVVRGWLERRYPNTLPLKPRGAAAAPNSENDRWRGWDQGRGVKLQHGVCAAPPPRQLGRGAA